MPFMNPEEYLIPEKPINTIGNESDINIKWSVSESSSAEVQATIYIDKILMGVLRDSIRPGWSNLVKKDSPLTRIFYKKLI